MKVYEYSCLESVHSGDVARQLNVDAENGYRVSHVVSHNGSLVFLLEKEKTEESAVPSSN
jgi:hypothetical protein